MSDSWMDLLVNDPVEAAGVLRDAKRIAVLGIKTGQQGAQPAYYVPEYLQNAGYEIIPVPVYYPDVTQILGQPVQRDLASIAPPPDLVVVFRRPGDIDRHVDDLVALGPAAVWFQSGIRNDGAARRLAEAGIRVVQDRCTMVEHRRLRR